MGDTMALAAKFEQVLKRGDFAGMTDLLMDNATDDFVEVWPQSGERLDKRTAMRMIESYAKESGQDPKFQYERMRGGGDTFVIEGTIDYGDGVPVRYVGIGETRGDKVSKMTEYFANPFEPPAWRKAMLEGKETVRA